MAKSAPQQGLLSRTLTGGQGILFYYICQPCSGDNKTLEAVGFCVDCSEFLCDECFKYHLKPTPSRNHKLLDIEEAKKDKNIVKQYRDVCTEKCVQHKGKIIEYICSDHDSLGCGACMTLDHRNCPGVKYIPDIAEDEAKGKEYSELIEELECVLLRTRCLIRRSTDNINKSHKDCVRALEHVQQMKKDTIEAFEQLEKDMKEKAEKMKMKDAQNMDSNIKSFESIQTKARAMVTNLTRMKNNGQYCKLFTAMKTEKCDIKSLDDKLDKAANDNTVADYKFQPSNQLEELLKYKDNLGKLCQQDSVKSKATKVGEISVRTDSDDGACCMGGLVSLPRARLVAADHLNKKVKLIDVKQAKVISELILPYKPWGITATDEEDELAVALGYLCKILLLKVRGDTLQKYREIQTSGIHYDVASVMDNFVVSLVSPERLEIIDKQGNVLHKIVHDQTGKQLFSKVRNVAVSQDRGIMYAPDLKEDTVTCLSLSGKVKAVYKNGSLKSAMCVAVGQRGVVYVGGLDSENVHQITPDCRKISILLPQDIPVFPYSLCYSTETDCLYVEECNTILIYQLS